MINGMENAGVDHQTLLDTYIRAINVCTRDRPDDLIIGVHMCRGNYKVCAFTNKILVTTLSTRAECTFLKEVMLAYL